MTDPDAIPVAFPRLTAWAHTFAGLRGWRRHGVAALCGATAAAALPPLHLVPLLIVAFTGLLWLLDGAQGTRRPRQAALIGWSFGFGHMAAGLYWVGIAFLVDSARFGLIMPFAVAGLAAGMALFPTLAVYAVALTGWRGPARVVLLAAAWLALEWLRSWLFTGFPWNLIGTVWSFSPAMLQLASVTGVWGLTWLTVLAAAAPAVLAEPDGLGARGGRRARAFVITVFAMIGLVWAGGALRLAAAPAPGTAVVPDVRLRLVQASIPQALKWVPEMRRRHVDQQRQLSLRAGPAPVTHIIWPETAVPYLLDQDPDLRRILAEIVPLGGLLITGTPRAADAGDPRLWNSLQALDEYGEIVATYDKHHLVPFGEYTPLRRLLGAMKLTTGSTDFSAGPGPMTLTLPGLPAASPLVCYEAIFPGQVVAAGDRPGWLLNITNDGWFGNSSGPYQHLASARMRAVEEGLPLIRVANSGISAVVDPFGRLIGHLALNQIGVLDASLPLPIAGGTLYARIGNLAVLFLAALSFAFILILRRFFP
ncbi:MAG: apolipoprotein N-acyltransferase [Alphaproteobacteria bacterium]